MLENVNGVTLLFVGLGLLTCSHLLRITAFRKKNPPSVRYLLPWFGSALSIGSDLLGWIERQSECHGPLFSAYIGGKTFIFVCDRKAGMRVINSKSSDLSDREGKYKLQRNALGMTHLDASDISKSTEKKEIQTRHLLRLNVLPILLENYQKHILFNVYPNILQDKNVNGQDWMKKGILDFFGEAIWRATVTVLYELPELDSYEAFKLAMTFDENFLKFSNSRLFQRMHWKQYKAREDIIGLVKNALKKRDQHGDEANPFKEKVGMELDHMSKKMGMNLDGRARFQVLSIHAAVLNTVPTTFWTVYHLLENPDAYNAVVEELQQIKKKSKFFSMDALNEMTKLDSVLMETLRLDSTEKQFRMRTVERDFDLELPFDDGTKKSFPVKKGTTVVTVPPLMNRDEEVFENAQSFQWDRFAKQTVFKKNNKVIQSPVEAFGGGPTMCPGRNFAKVEIKALVASILCEYEVRFAKGLDAEKPGLRDKKLYFSFGVPESDVEIEFRARV